MSSAAPLVTVVVPAFNAERTLAETLRSVLSQTYRNIEVFVVDDGSTDGTAGVARSFAADDPRLTLIRKENGGCASARNLGIARARGPFIAPIDADDLWHPTKLEKQVSAALAAPEPPGFVYCFFRPIDADANLARPIAPYACRHRVLVHHLHMNFVGNGSGPLLSRAAALEVGGYDERFDRRGVFATRTFFSSCSSRGDIRSRSCPSSWSDTGPELAACRPTSGKCTIRGDWCSESSSTRSPPSRGAWCGGPMPGAASTSPKLSPMRATMANATVAGAGSLARPAGNARTIALPHHEVPPPPDSGRCQIPASRAFLDCSTIERFPGDPYETGRAWLSLQRMGERRRAWIDRHAARHAPDGSGGPAAAEPRDHFVPA